MINHLTSWNSSVNLLDCFSLNAGIFKWLCKFDLIHLAPSVSYTSVSLWYLVVIHWISFPFGTLRELYVRCHKTIHILISLQTIFRGVCEKIFLILPYTWRIWMKFYYKNTLKIRTGFKIFAILGKITFLPATPSTAGIEGQLSGHSSPRFLPPFVFFIL